VAKRIWPEAIFYDSKNTLFDWDSVWIRASSKILEKYRRSDIDPLLFWRHWQTFLTGENHKVAFSKFRRFTESHKVALQYAYKCFGIQGDPEDVKFMTDMWNEVYPFPDVVSAFKEQQKYTKILIYSNVETEYLEMMVGKLGDFRPDFLGDMDKSQCCKPSPRAYRWVLEQVGLETGDVLYCAGVQWDVQGALAFGMKAALVCRPYRFTGEVEGIQPDYVVKDLHELTEIVKKLTG